MTSAPGVSGGIVETARIERIGTMEKPRDDCCGCCGPGKPVYELRNLLNMLERQEAEKKEKEARAHRCVLLPDHRSDQGDNA
jgi:hypothetical protein